jgi:hypothetical protein
MCFSAAASFTAAGLLISLGAMSIALVRTKAKPSMTRRQRNALTTLAAVPLIFGFHQFSEGLVWINPNNHAAVRLFTYTAYTFWPMYISLSLALVEWTRSVVTSTNGQQGNERFCTWPHVFPLQVRKWLLISNTLVGLVLLAFLTDCLAKAEPITAYTDNDRLEYTICELEEVMTYAGVTIYAYVVVGSLFLSSLKYSSQLGLASLLSLVMTLALWEAQFQSTWCFFAAVLSCILIVTVWLELLEYQSSDLRPDQQQQQLEEQVAAEIKTTGEKLGLVDDDDDDDEV